MLRGRPQPEAYLLHTIEQPYEIHWVTFATETDFFNFTQDAERKCFLHLKEQSIKAGLLVKGEKL